jgi:hypothetical protein
MNRSFVHAVLAPAGHMVETAPPGRKGWRERWPSLSI